MSKSANLPCVEWKLFKLDKFHPRLFWARVEFPCRCGEKIHLSMWASQEELLNWIWWLLLQDYFVRHGHIHLFSMPLLSLLGLSHLTWLLERARGGGVGALVSRGLVPHSCKEDPLVKLKWDGTDCVASGLGFWRSRKFCIFFPHLADPRREPKAYFIISDRKLYYFQSLSATSQEVLCAGEVLFCLSPIRYPLRSPLENSAKWHQAITNWMEVWLLNSERTTSVTLNRACSTSAGAHEDVRVMDVHVWLSRSDIFLNGWQVLGAQRWSSLGLAPSSSAVEGTKAVNQPVRTMPSVIHPQQWERAVSAGKNRRFQLPPWGAWALAALCV